MELNEEDKYRNIIDNLKQLPKINAPDYFEADLMRKINTGRLDIESSFWEKLFKPSKLIPTAALAVTVIIILFMVRLNPSSSEDPLTTNPKIREDITSMKEMPEIMREDFTVKDQMKAQSTNKKGEAAKKKSTMPNDYGMPGKVSKVSKVSAQRSNGNINAANTSIYTINKNGLNYRIVNLNPAERVKINQMRAKLMLLVHDKSFKR